jgi:tripartite-type tricarboxylate transporter receptor subunit TctC
MTAWMTRRTALSLAASAVAASLVGGRAVAQDAYPNRLVRMVVPYPPGGPTDALARIVGEDLQATFGQTVLIENRPGASGAVGTREVARAEADGYTIVLGNNQTHATNAFLLKEPGYDPLTDFQPIAGLADLQHVLVVRNGLGVSTVADLIAVAKKDPGKLNYGSTGLGSGSHLAMELFKTRTGTDMQHVPFRGAAPMAQEIAADRIDLAFATLPSVLGLLQGNMMKGLAVASLQRAPQLPDVPLLREQGVTDGEADSWLALFAPAKTPEPVMARLSTAVMAALAKPAVRDRAIQQGIAVNVRGPADFKTYQQAEIGRWSAVAKAANVQPQGG